MIKGWIASTATDPGHVDHQGWKLPLEPVIDDAEASLRVFGGPSLPVAKAVALLPNWRHHAQLSDQDVAGVLARFVPEPADTCYTCGEAIVYVTDGPQQGSWRHVTTVDGRSAHGAYPRYQPTADPDAPDYDEDGNPYFTYVAEDVRERIAALASKDDAKTPSPDRPLVDAQRAVPATRARHDQPV